jgi:hypothetical protein
MAVRSRQATACNGADLSDASCPVAEQRYTQQRASGVFASAFQQALPAPHSLTLPHTLDRLVVAVR